MKSKDVLAKLGVTRPTLCKYVKDGVIKVTKKKNGQYDYDENSIYQFLGLKFESKHKVNVSYSRVSTQAQVNQLKEQTIRIYNSCIARNVVLDEQIEDIKSGMDVNRKGFQRLIERVLKGEIGFVVIENKDRLTRFNFDTLEFIFKYFGTQIVVLNDSIDNKTYEQELTDDLISIIHYFTMKSYSHRRKLDRIRKELEEIDSVNKNN